jgi:4-diphosphocytidyl-2-C-methyl-D-erythritol kinase
MHLDKHLPHGAGLGGGSSDAATTLRALRDLWSLDAADADLHPLAARLGSDVPFFLGPKAAYATGRGEQLAPLTDPATGNLYELPFALVVAVPPAAVSTAEAYRRVTPRATGRPDLRAVVLSNDLDRWRADLTNDFEASVFAQYPVIRHTKQALVDAGAGYASMSGSGSAVFGVFTDEAQARAATEALRASGHRVWHGVTG